MRSRPGQRAGTWLTRRRHSRQLPETLGRSYDLALTWQQQSRNSRSSMVAELVDVFFDLCVITGADHFVEAGAKEAGASLRALDVGFSSARAFEANPYTHKRFKRKLKKSPVKYRNVALTDEPGSVTFLVRLRDDGTPIPDGQGSLLVRPDHEPGYEDVTVKGVRLDDALAKMGAGRIAMWVDVEGAVDKVFGGASDTLDRCDVVIVEVESRSVWDGQAWIDRDVHAALAQHGLVPVARDAQSRFQYNVLYLRRSLLGETKVRQRLAEWRRGVA